MIPWLWGAAVALLVVGAVGGLVLAPVDYQQGQAYRILFVHVPSAWMAMFVYMFMAG
ncbi:MAG TPA: heme ABC transporter permease, partial [Gammaproteobacteria bacterium]|nr:heme ABC transporter permease [Gammaproteobacteria bacterium]